MKFYNRIKEKNFLKEKIKEDKKSMIVIYGRRRVGKTFLLKNLFPKAKYFFVDTRSSETLLSDFSGELINGKYDDWESFFKELFKRENLIIIDEFQNFSKVDKSVFSILQKVWDEEEKNIKLILCGSYLGMMKKIFLDSKEPLFGRSKYQIQLKPFTFLDTFEMLSDFGYSLEETVDWYSILGGVPNYLWYLEEKEPLKDKLNELFFSDFAPFKDEGKNLLIDEFGSSHPGYLSVLESIGIYNKNAGEIVDKSNMERTKAMKYVNELINYFEIIKKETILFDKKKRGARYKISDNFLRFWFSFIYSKYSMVEYNPKMALEYAYKNYKNLVGFCFEDIIKQLLPLFYEKGLVPCEVFRAGKYWGKDEKNRVPVEIDLIGECENKLLIVECKWTNKVVTEKMMEEFIQKTENIKTLKQKEYLYISKSGFQRNEYKNIIQLSFNNIQKAIEN